MNTEPIQVALAILYRQGQFLLQLRDDVLGIVYPGCWGFFGGHIEPGESPEIGLRRELGEEISYNPTLLTSFGCYSDPRVVRHVFSSPLTVAVEDLVLYEGWDLGLWTPEAVRRGDRYSQQAQQVRSLAPPARQILLDFLDTDVWVKM